MNIMSIIKFRQIIKYRQKTYRRLHQCLVKSSIKHPVQGRKHFISNSIHRPLKCFKLTLEFHKRHFSRTFLQRRRAEREGDVRKECRSVIMHHAVRGVVHGRVVGIAVTIIIIKVKETVQKVTVTDVVVLDVSERDSGWKRSGRRQTQDDCLDEKDRVEPEVNDVCVRT